MSTAPAPKAEIVSIAASTFGEIEDACCTGSEGGCGSWEQSGQQQSGLQSRSPDRSPYSREPGNGNRPKANDPQGWSRGENRPTELEFKAMIK